MKLEDFLAMYRVGHDGTFRLKDHDPDWAGDPVIPKEDRKKFAEDVLTQDVSDLAKAQDKLYAADSCSLLVIFQAMDAAGKDGTIKHVMSGVNPQGCQVFSFKQPSKEELDHNFLWRYTRALPERGRIGIFNRSYYEDVLVVRVHPELVRIERIAGAKLGEQFWNDRFEDVNALEKHLTRNGTRVLKFFLNISRNEQRKRFLKRLDDPEKNWKFSLDDLKERGHWDDYMEVYEKAIRATSTEWAPWYVVPANHKWVARSIVARAIVNAVDAINPNYPEVPAEHREVLREARRQLEAEGDDKAGNDGQPDDNGDGHKKKDKSKKKKDRKVDA